jgi:hypothetical protein
MEVTFDCFLSAQVMEPDDPREYLREFLSDISGILQVVTRAFVIVWGESDLAPEPNYLLPSFDEEGTLTLPFSFQYFQLEETYLRIELLKSLLSNLAYGKGIDVDFEYYLEGTS